MAARACLLNAVLVRVRTQGVHQAHTSVILVLLKLVPRESARGAPLLEILLMPHYGVAIRAVGVGERNKRHREVLPDVLAELQIWHSPALENLLLHRALGYRLYLLAHNIHHQITPHDLARLHELVERIVHQNINIGHF